MAGPPVPGSVRLELDPGEAVALAVLLHRAISQCPDEQVAHLYHGLTRDLPAVPGRDDPLPLLRAAIPVQVREDRIVDGHGLVRDAGSSPVMVAVLHDGTDAAFEQALDLAGSLGVAIALAVSGGG